MLTAGRPIKINCGEEGPCLPLRSRLREPIITLQSECGSLFQLEKQPGVDQLENEAGKWVMSFPFPHLLQQMSIFCLFVLVILKHCCSSFHPFSIFQQVHFCKYSPEVESMEAAKSQFSYICLSCRVLLKERKRVLRYMLGELLEIIGSSDGKSNCLWCWWGRNMPLGSSCTVVLLSRKGDGVLSQRLDRSWILS